MNQLIAIVGRPNVGKSTLFNSLTSSRHALVLDEDGITRDCQYGSVEIAGREISLVDTAGLIGESAKGMNHVVEKKVWATISDCDLVLLVVDANAGLTDEDRQIHKHLQKAGAHILVCANKVDSDDVAWKAAEFHQLGSKEVLAISAKRKNGFATLLDKVGAFLPEVVVTSKKIQGPRITLIGRPNVGKSTLFNSIIGEETAIVYDEPGTTRDSLEIGCLFKDKSYTLVDTAGMRRRRQVQTTIEKYSIIQAVRALSSADVVIYVVDANEGLVDQDLKLIRQVMDAGKGCVIAFNKWDSLDEDARDAFAMRTDRKLVHLGYLEQVPISAIRSKGLVPLFSAIDRAYLSATSELKTAEVNEVLRMAVQAHEPPIAGRHRIKLRYAHVIDLSPPTILIHGTQTSELSDAYKRYLIRCYRDHFNLEGTDIRLKFKSSENPFKGKATLTGRQIKKRNRLKAHIQKLKKKKRS